MIRRLFLFSLAGFWALSVVPALSAQSSQSTPTNQITPAAASSVKMPSNANALMRLAAKVNGLDGTDMKPWHLKARYKIDDSSNSMNEGTFEEWWVGPEEYKVSYTDRWFRQIQYRTATGLFIAGDVKKHSMAEMIEQLLVHPLPTVEEVRTRNYLAYKAKAGTTPLECVQALAPWQSPVGPLYCFDHDIPVIRLENPYVYSTTALFNGIVQVDGRYVAKQINVRFMDPLRNQYPLETSMSRLNVGVTTLEPLPKVRKSEFVPPVSAVPAPKWLPVWVTEGTQISGTKPEYPAIAKAAHIQGTVTIRATISAEGAVSHMEVVSGPQMLRVAALNAVKTWRYKPFRWNDRAVTSERLVEVIFRLP